VESGHLVEGGGGGGVGRGGGWGGGGGGGARKKPLSPFWILVFEFYESGMDAVVRHVPGGDQFEEKGACRHVVFPRSGGKCEAEQTIRLFALPVKSLLASSSANHEVIRGLPGENNTTADSHKKNDSGQRSGASVPSSLNSICVGAATKPRIGREKRSKSHPSPKE